MDGIDPSLVNHSHRPCIQFVRTGFSAVSEIYRNVDKNHLSFKEIVQNLDSASRPLPVPEMRNWLTRCSAARDDPQDVYCAEQLLADVLPPERWVVFMFDRSVVGACLLTYHRVPGRVRPGAGAQARLDVVQDAVSISSILGGAPSSTVFS